jgi:hypothetical protein
VARKDGDRPDSARKQRGRFSRSGHTQHAPHQGYPAGNRDPGPGSAYPPYESRTGYDPRAAYGAGAGYQPPPEQPPGGFGSPTYHHIAGAERRAAQEPAVPAASITRAAFRGTNRAARVVTRKVIEASKADGANESGLTQLIWNQVLSYGTDAMITVALAGTVFFGASAHAQRGNVLLYLLVTMAPFAVVAPVIGPALDRVQHGRRWAMAATAIGRAILALIMAAHPSDLLVLYPCALGSLVLSKAYGVVRAAAAPRLVPPKMTLTQANSRLTVFGLGSALVLGGFVGIVIKISGSYTAGLVLTAIGFAACGAFALRLPKQVDSAVDARRHPEEPMRLRSQQRVPPITRIRRWAKRGFDDHLVTALLGESSLRLLSGLLTIYLAFYVEATAHGLAAAVQLGGVVVAAGAGNLTGTAIGTKLKLPRPELLIVISVGAAAASCLLVALLFDIVLAIIGMFISAVANSMSKVSLDTLIQRDVAETLRSSAFGRSETFLQLAWVLGAALGVLLPASRGVGGALGFWVAGGIMACVATVVILHARGSGRAAAPARPPHG